MIVVEQQGGVACDLANPTAHLHISRRAMRAREGGVACSTEVDLLLEVAKIPALNGMLS